MKKLRLLNSILTLSLTSVALISSVMGWYVNNNEAKANGLKAQAKEAEVTGGTLRRYKAIINKDSEGNVTSYQLGDDVDLASTTLDPYDQLNGHDQIIYELAVTLTSTNFKLTLANNDSNISNAIDISDTKDSDNKTYGTNYLSNVATFQLLTTTDNGSTFTTTNFYDNTDTKEIGYISDRKDKINKITLIDTTVDSNVQKVYLLFDYSVENIEKLISANIGKIYDKVYFSEDLKFDLE